VLSAAGLPVRSGPETGLYLVRRAIEDACLRSHRDPASVTLVAASKRVPADVLEQAIAAGQKAFGENRVQEARQKWPPLRERHPGLELHLIGPLQTNKVRDAVILFDVIQSVDRPGLCEALGRHCDGLRRQPRLFVQVNTGAEPQKAGILPQHADAFIVACRREFGLKIAGLMCIPPADAPPARHFSVLFEIAARNRLDLLSMGMSADFTLAVEHGATHVRVGSAIFGDRAR